MSRPLDTARGDPPRPPPKMSPNISPKSNSTPPHCPPEAGPPPAEKPLKTNPPNPFELACPQRVEGPPANAWPYESYSRRFLSSLKTEYASVISLNFDSSVPPLSG